VTESPFQGMADIAVRQKAFAASLHTLTRQQLFEKRRALEKAAQSATVGSDEGESKDLIAKNLAIEAEILMRYGSEGLSEYKIWRFAHEAIER
jgi:hypothetical protein